MEKVRILNDIHIEHSGHTFKAGQEVEVSDVLAKRHTRTGLMKIIKPETAKPSSPKLSKKD